MNVLWSIIFIYNFASLLEQPHNILNLVPDNIVMLIDITSRKTGPAIDDLYQNEFYFYAELRSI